jgi:hypothetical protein
MRRPGSVYWTSAVPIVGTAAAALSGMTYVSTRDAHLPYRMIVGAQKCMLFEPSSSSSQKFLDLVLPRLAASDSERARFALRATGQALSIASRSPWRIMACSCLLQCSGGVRHWILHRAEACRGSRLIRGSPLHAGAGAGVRVVGRPGVRCGCVAAAALRAGAHGGRAHGGHRSAHPARTLCRYCSAVVVPVQVPTVDMLGACRVRLETLLPACRLLRLGCHIAGRAAGR